MGPVRVYIMSSGVEIFQHCMVKDISNTFNKSIVPVFTRGGLSLACLKIADIDVRRGPIILSIFSKYLRATVTSNRINDQNKV